MINRCRHGAVYRDSSGRLWRLCVCTIKLQRCNHRTGQQGSAWNRHRGRSGHVRDFQGRDFHKKSYSIWIRIFLLLAMAMQIKDKSYFSFLANFLKKILYARHFRASRIFFSCVPLSVKIFSSQICSIVSKDHSIRVYHRNNINHIIFP